jgi:hypothetical protein
MRRALAILALGSATAAADPRLAVTHEPPPRHLRMRARAAQVTPPASTRPTPMPMPAAPPTLSSANDDDVTALRNIHQPVSVTFDLGYLVENANTSGKATLGGSAPTRDRDYALLRSYGFGEAFVSTRGLGLASLETYFATRLQAARSTTARDPSTGQNVDIPPPIATWFERSGGEVRYGWAEVKDFLPTHLGLSKLRVRAGGQHVYGPWVIHLDGVLASYDGRIVTATGYTGFRHSDYTRDQSIKRAAVAGGSLRVDLRGLPSPIPVAVQTEYLALGEALEQPATSSALLQADWRPRRDVAVIGQLRALDRKLANQHLEVRARYRQVTNFVFDVMHRDQDDWRWDPSLVATEDPTAPRRYLDLGPVVPQLVASMRAGTLIAENVDLYVRGAAAADVSKTGQVKSSFAAPYLEIGGALEVRLRRTVSLGASALTRQTKRDPAPGILDVHMQLDPLPANPAVRGEDGFTEVGTSLRMTLGARRFSGLVELYGRRTRYPAIYVDPILAVPASDVRGGGRVTLDAWVGKQLRLFAAFDMSSAFDFAPEITGYKSLRLMMSGVY